MTEAVAAWVAVELFVEPKLSRTFRDEYATYRTRVRRWLPGWTPWQPPRPSQANISGAHGVNEEVGEEVGEEAGEEAGAPRSSSAEASAEMTEW